MSKINPSNTSLRKPSPKSDTTSSSSTTPTSSTASSSKTHTGQSGTSKSIPKLKSRNDTPLEESDGYAVRNHPDIKDDPRDDDDEEAIRQRWNSKLEAQQQEYEAKSKKLSDREKKQKADMHPDIPEITEAIAAKRKEASAGKKSGTKKSGSASSMTSAEPRLSIRERSSTFRETLRGGLQRLGRASMTTADFQVASFGELISGRWIPDMPVKQDADGFPQLDMLPAEIRKAMSDEYASFTDVEKSSSQNADGIEKELKLALAKRFLSMVLNGDDNDFDQSKISSLAEINRHLSGKFGFKIEPLDSPASTERGTPSSPRSPKSPLPETDFIDLLVQDAVFRSRNDRAE